MIKDFLNCLLQTLSVFSLSQRSLHKMAPASLSGLPSFRERNSFLAPREKLGSQQIPIV